MYMPNYKTEDKNNNKNKPTATVSSIQRGQHSTGSYQAPQNLFHQERNQLNPAPQQYLPASQPGPAPSLHHPQPGLSSSQSQQQLSDLEETIMDIIDLAGSNTEDNTWTQNLVGRLNVITSASQPTNESPRHWSYLYDKCNKDKGQVITFLFDSGSIINVIPLHVFNLIEADCNPINPNEIDFTSCTDYQINILGKTILSVVFKDKIV